MARPKSNRPKHGNSNPQEHRMIRNIDELSVMQDLFSNFLGDLKKDLANGVDAKALAAKYANLAQARVITTALTDQNSATALSAAKDIIDRAHGKATEKKHIEHSMAQASNEEIDALIESKLRSVEEIGSDE